MKLKKFIEKLKDIADREGKDVEVVMADNIPVINPRFSDKYPKPSVVITDQNGR